MALPVSISKPSSTVHDLLSKARSLLHELSLFGKYMQSQDRENAVDLRTFRVSIASELKALERLSTAETTDPHTSHAIRSSNLSFYVAVWETAKSCTGLLAFSRRFFLQNPQSHKLTCNERIGDGRKRSVVVDIVAKEGEEWIKVSTITEDRLLFELAKVQWEWSLGDSDESEGGDEAGDGLKLAAGVAGSSFFDDEDEAKIELLQVATTLKRAAKVCRVRYKCPQIRFVLPRIVSGRTPAVDAVLAEIRATGAVVDCSCDSSALSFSNLLPSPVCLFPLGSTFSTLLPSPHPNLTSVLNIDCTILLALASDLSHLHLHPGSHLHTAINHQIVSENSERLLCSSLYPALKGHTLICAHIAARRMRQIVDLIGTPSEKARVGILMGDIGSAGKLPVELRTELAAQSVHPVPPDLLLPISVISETVQARQLPNIAMKLEPLLSEINRAVFFLGWAKDLTTMTSNRTVARLVEDTIESECHGKVIGPKVWVCQTARSLAGKESGREKNAYLR